MLTAQTSLDAHQIERKQMSLAMSVGTSRHYRISDITGRHFIQTGEAEGLPKYLVRDALEEMADTAEHTIGTTEKRIASGISRCPAHIS